MVSRKDKRFQSAQHLGSHWFSDNISSGGRQLSCPCMLGGKEGLAHLSIVGCVPQWNSQPCTCRPWHKEL